jgi:hypothetical protein
MYPHTYLQAHTCTNAVLAQGFYAVYEHIRSRLVTCYLLPTKCESPSSESHHESSPVGHHEANHKFIKIWDVEPYNIQHATCSTCTSSRPDTRHSTIARTRQLLIGSWVKNARRSTIHDAIALQFEFPSSCPLIHICVCITARSDLI